MEKPGGAGLAVGSLMVLFLVLVSFAPFSVGLDSSNRSRLSDPMGSPVGPVVIWKHDVNGSVMTSPVVSDIDGDGASEIIVGCEDFRVYCLNSSGSTRWFFDAGGFVFSPPVVADVDGDGLREVVFGSVTGELLCLNGSGFLKWGFQTLGSIYSSPAISDVDEDGQLEVVTGSSGLIYCLNGTGGVEWTFAVNGSFVCSPIIDDVNMDGHDEVVICEGLNGNNVYFLDGRGSLEYHFCPNGNVYQTPIIGDIDGDGAKELIISPNNDHLYCWDCGLGNVTMQWRYWGNSFPELSFLRDEATGYMDVLCAGSGFNLYCLSSNGSLRWAFATAHNILGAALVVDIDGDNHTEVVVASGDHVVYCLDGGGLLKWSLAAANSFSDSPAASDVDKDGQLEIIAGSGNMVYCIGVLPRSGTGTGGLVLKVSGPGRTDVVPSRLWLVQVNFSSQPVGQVVLGGLTDHSGFVAFESLLNGSYELVVSKPDYNNVTVHVDVVSDRVTFLEVNLSLISIEPPPPPLPPNDQSLMLLGLSFMSIIFLLDAVVLVRFVRARNASLRKDHGLKLAATGVCRYCGASVNPSHSPFCGNCGRSIRIAPRASDKLVKPRKAILAPGNCMVCNLKLNAGDETVMCPACGNVAHKTHMLEWLHVKNYCPVCHKHLDEGDLQ